MGDRLRAGMPSRTSFGWDKGGNVTSAGWQVTLCESLCDPVWHVSSRSGVATLRTAIHLLLTYLLPYLLTSTAAVGLHSSNIRSNNPHYMHGT